LSVLPSIREISSNVIDNVERVILGKHEEVRLVLVALLCEGHLLIEDVPGVGKTMLAKSIARSLGCTYARIQCTPDLLPSDILGVNVFNQQSGAFEFRPGPVFNNIVLADEINRATPKTQSALLECMEERQVTVDGITRALPRPFMVIATQNPVEYEGTFPLPEAQLDRFFMRLRLGYPSFDAENEMLIGQKLTHPIESIESVVTTDELLKLQKEVREIFVEPALREYIVNIVQETRKSGDYILGASPRGSLALFRAAQAFSALENRDYILPDDVKKMAEVTLSHRMIGRYDSKRSISGNGVLSSIIGRIAVPVINK